MHDRAWCYLRWLVQAVYRETRHIGPSGDKEARCEVQGHLEQAAERCRRNRWLLQGVQLWKEGDKATLTSEILAPYVFTTGLRLEQLPELFRLPQWHKTFGGPRWARIAGMTIRMRDALDEGQARLLDELCDEAKILQHNSGHLVPSPHEWRGYKKQKWPELCHRLQ